MEERQSVFFRDEALERFQKIALHPWDPICIHGLYGNIYNPLLLSVGKHTDTQSYKEEKRDLHATISESLFMISHIWITQELSTKPDTHIFLFPLYYSNNICFLKLISQGFLNNIGQQVKVIYMDFEQHVFTNWVFYWALTK